MAGISKYQKYVKSILNKYGAIKPINLPEDTEVQVVCDDEKNHYYLTRLGWQRHKRIYGNLLHIDIKNGKIWIQYDGTEEGVANELLEMGVSKEDIVLAFYLPYKRPHTGFAVS